MPTSLPFEEHLTVLESAGRRLGDVAVEAGHEAPVPTCPAWTCRALLAHQTMVHRWATAHVLGTDPGEVPTQTAIRDGTADLDSYYREGHAGLLGALRRAPEDLRAMTFLDDCPPPRAFWARRQAHETTIHMVDALAARLGRRPSAAEAVAEGVEPALAADGIDELLRGFFTRGRSKLFDGEEYGIEVVAEDVGRRWIVRVAERLTVDPDSAEGERRGDPAGSGTDATIAGPAVDLYLALWNRGGQLVASGRPDVLARWKATQRVSW